MARFRLKADSYEKDLGKLILQMAEAAGPNNGKIGDPDKMEFEQRLKDMIDPAYAGQIEFVYDTPDKIHVVVPFLGKTVYSDNDFANEAMGVIVIKGCGR
jgi:hypothetical protein